MSSPSPRPFAETSRLRIRSLRDSDIPLVATLYNDPHTSRTNPTWVVPKPDSALQKELSERIPTALLYSVIEAKEPLEDGNDWVGVVMLSFDGSPKNRDVEMAICLDARFWGKGYGKEATKWVVEHAFHQLGMHRVSLGVLGNNERAIALYKSIGFVEEGRKRKHNFQDGKWWDIVHMGILDEEWKSG